MTRSPSAGVCVLVTDPEQRAALAAVRSLGVRGWTVHTVGASSGIASASRHARRFHAVSRDQVTDPERYREAVREAVRRGCCQVIVPVTDGASRMLLGHDQELGAIVAGPSAEAYARASDKEGLLRAAHAVGIRVPQQITLDSHLASRPDAHVALPLVVKPARSVVEVNGRTVRVGVRFADDDERLHVALSRYPGEAYPLLLQERIVGPGVGVFLLRQNGRTLLQFGHKRLREKPPSGGVSTYREALAPPPDLVDACERLLDALAYDGAAMIEFKQDERTGEYVLMEINARLWGSVQLAVDAGVDFPAALVAMSLGLPVESPTNVCYGTRSVWELGELDHALMLWRRSADALNLPASVPTGARAAMAVLLDHRLSDHPEIFRWTDPRPFMVELGRWLRRR